MIHPTVTPVPFTLGGKEYSLIFTFRSLAKARAIGVNLMRSIDPEQINDDQWLQLFAIAARVDPEEIADVPISVQTMLELTASILGAWMGSMPPIEEDKVNPPTPTA